MTHRVGAKGQVVIPKELRDALQIRPGHEVIFEQRGDEVVVRKAGSRPLRARFPGSGLTDALSRARAEDRAAELPSQQ